MTVVYYWIVEQLDGDAGDDPDILDSVRCDSLKECCSVAESLTGVTRIGLVRDVIDKYTSVSDRAWAYLAGGVLPDEFTDALGYSVARVPNRFR